MPKLKIKFTRGQDKKDVLSIVREDGSQSWQHQPRGIPAHDLTHYAVESTLGLKDGFYGLLVQGWDIHRLTDRDVRQHLPPEGLWTEFVVGLIQSERLSPAPLTTVEFNDMLGREMADFGLKIGRRVEDEELARIRGTFERVFGQWKVLGPGESMSLDFG